MQKKTNKKTKDYTELIKIKEEFHNNLNKILINVNKEKLKPHQLIGLIVTVTMAVILILIVF